jgi:tetratricopeptide (TPR) repeat protein
MPFRFFQRFRIAPGLRLNVSKGGLSVSAGPRGARFTLGTSGTRATAGLPGTGLHYTVLNPHLNPHLNPQRQQALPMQASDATGFQAATEPSKAPRLGWLQRLTMDGDTKQFLEGWQAWGRADIDAALLCFEAVAPSSTAGADAAWSAAILAAQREAYAQSIHLLQRALKTPTALGQAFKTHGFTPQVQVPVTPEIMATMLPTEQSALLLLAEVQQAVGQYSAALQTLGQVLPLQASEAVDPVILAAFGELARESKDTQAIDRFNGLAAELGNDSPVHTIVMYYRAQVLMDQRLHHAALEVLTPALRRTKTRHPALLLEIRFLRAKAYEALGRKAQARKDFERIYAADPGFEGIREALDLA